MALTRNPADPRQAAALTWPTAPKHHGDAGEQIRDRGEEAHLLIAQIPQALDDLRSPEAETVEAKDEAEVDGGEEPYPAAQQAVDQSGRRRLVSRHEGCETFTLALVEPGC
jgi:hypothetical protein